MLFARALTVLAAVAVLTASPSAAAAQSPDPVRVMSYNIRYDGPDDTPPWSERRSPMSRQIAFFEPDFLGLQEALPAQVDWLAGVLSAWDHYGVGRDDGALKGETTTLFWRRDRFEPVSRSTFWCSPTPDRPSKGWDADYPRTVTRVVLRDREDGRLWDVRNTHFDHVGVEARARCADLVAALPPVEGAEVVLMGDFNTGPDTEPWRRLVASGLRDARAVSPVVFGPDGTYNAFDITKDNNGIAIDHVFVGPGLSVERFAVPTDSFAGKVISDHFPLVVDVVPTRP